MIDDAIKMLGPVEKAKPNPLFQHYIEAMKKAIKSAKNKFVIE